MSEQRKTVYTIRHQLLVGRYSPEKMDEDGKLLGVPRKIETLPRFADDVRTPIKEMLLRRGRGTKLETGRASEPEQLDGLSDVSGFQGELYQFYGYRMDFRSSDENRAAEVYRRAVDEVAQSLTEQRERMLDLVDGVLAAIIEECCPANAVPEDWDLKGLRNGFLEHFGRKLPSVEGIHDIQELARFSYKQAEELILEKEREMGAELLLRVFRHFYLEEIDRAWVEHLTNMEHLRDGIGLRGYGQRDPKQEYKKEGYDIFVNMMASISSNTITKLFQVRVERDAEIERIEREDAARHEAQLRSMRARHEGVLEPNEEPEEAPAVRRAPPRIAAPPRRESAQVTRNDLCPCGSGLKFRKCHGAAIDEDDGDSGDASP
jgi:preprotein translocase subunit SecA